MAEGNQEGARVDASLQGDIDAFDAWSMIESSPDGMLLVDEQGRILVANTRIEALFGYNRADLVGRVIEDLLPERHRGAHRAHRTRYRVAPTVRAMGEGSTLSGLRRDGTEFPVEVSLSPIDRDGRMRVVATVRDISSRLSGDAHTHAVLTTVDAATDGMFMFSPDTLRFEYVNQGAINQVGYSEAELLSMTPLHIKPDFDHASFSRLLEPLIAGSVASRTFTTVHRRKDGTDIPVEIILEYPPARRPGDQRLVVGLVRDISQRLAAELDYRKTVEAFRAAFHRAPVAISLAVIDEEEVRLSSVNNAYCNLLGYEADELIGRTVTDLVVGSHRHRVAAAVERAVRREVTIGSIEVDLVRSDGAIKPVWAHSSVLETEGDKATTILTHVIDLSERLRTESERQLAARGFEALADIRAAVLNDLPQEEMMVLICRWAIELTGADNAFVTRPDRDSNRHDVVAVDRAATRSLLPESFEIDEPARRALAGELHRIPDLDVATDVDPTNRSAVRDRSSETQSGIIVRIATAPDPCLLFVISNERDDFGPTSIHMVEAFAAQAATALDLAQHRRDQTRLTLLEDRERIAHDFHDLVIQRLFAAGLNLSAARALVDDQDVVSRMVHVVDEIDEAIAELRSTIFHLTADAPVSPAQRLTLVVAKTKHWFGSEPSFQLEGDPDAMPVAVLEQLVPVLTEILSNAARHGAANEVDVVVTTDCSGTTLRVADNGVGFDADAVDRRGLANLVARAEQLGGDCTIETEPGCGATVTWTVPH